MQPDVAPKEETKNGLFEDGLAKSSGSRISTGSIICAIRNNQSYDSIRHLLAANPRTEVAEILMANQSAYSTIFASIYANRPELIKLLVEYGANPDATDHNGVPLLAYAIFNSSISATEIVRALLTLGANPYVIPSRMWEITPNQLYEKLHNGSDSQISWCDQKHQALLMNSLNISMKYYLLQASENIGSHQGTEAPAPIIGQNYAIKSVKEYLVAQHVCRSDSLPILAFVGPPGHGKRALARSLGNFHELSPFNTSPSSVNRTAPEDRNHPEVSNSETGGLDIFFIDGEKVDHAWLKALLNTVDNCAYRHQETKHLTRLNAVYILSVTQSEESLSRTYTNLYDINRYSDFKEVQFLDTKVKSQLKDELVQVYGTSIASRIQHIVPFVPITRLESSVLAHQFLTQAIQGLYDDYTRRCTAPVKYARRIELRADDDAFEYLGRFCAPGGGVRYIKQEVNTKVVLPMVKQYQTIIRKDVAGFKGLVTLKMIRGQDRPDDFTLFSNSGRTMISVEVE
ncbi:predicted protein [Uncinocarpus reesii 1704]|uniref:Uncharacterized protein n=1 Tax=Uncinocarpus reesii (strain UAMH 1704) TaxID=336963 RepID=C4JV34_UNCRE|nr:uncharacterized protein UREG_06426 [Uncinocarpus reesii 1704]EEP81561.1 predicted protein [Uncinocarpus reesii 1704]